MQHCYTLQYYYYFCHLVLTDYQLFIIKTSLTYRPFIAFLLALLVANAVLMKDLHLLLAHQHDTTPHCEANPSESHIHGEEFLVSTCFVCCFQFSPSEQTAFNLEIKLPSFSKETISPFAHSLLNGQTFSIKAPRGPPAFLA